MVGWLHGHYPREGVKSKKIWHIKFENGRSTLIFQTFCPGNFWTLFQVLGWMSGWVRRSVDGVKTCPRFSNTHTQNIRGIYQDVVYWWRRNCKDWDAQGDMHRDINFKVLTRVGILFDLCSVAHCVGPRLWYATALIQWLDRVFVSINHDNYIRVINIKVYYWLRI